MITWTAVLNTSYTKNVHNNKFQVQLGQIVDVHTEIWYFMQKVYFWYFCMYRFDSVIKFAEPNAIQNILTPKTKTKLEIKYAPFVKQKGYHAVDSLERYR